MRFDPLRRARRGALRAGALLWALTTTAAADPVLDQLETAKRAYQAGDSAVAIEALNIAIGQIQQQRTEQQLALFPPPLSGWSAEDATAEAGGIAAAFTGKVLSRTYRHVETGAEVVISITANSPFIGFISGLMQMPLLTQGGAGAGGYLHEGYRGLIEHQQDGSAKVSLLVGNDLLLQLDGSAGADQEMLEAYLENIDLERLEQAFGA
jgi:hypothetical protein